MLRKIKLFPWRRATQQTRFSAITLPAFTFCSKSSFPSQSDIIDPPFTPIAKTTPSIKNKLKTIIKSRQQHRDNSVNAIVNTDLSFDFMYSYSETSSAVEPIGYREPPKYSPFGPGRIKRKWTGICAPVEIKPNSEELAVERQKVLGEPLTEEEVAELVEKYYHNSCSRQINLGKGGVTHNMLDDIHNHWRRADAVRIKSLGVPTLDMDNICFHLEDKSGGKIIYLRTNILLLYRGRNYNFKNRPIIPVMLWKPLAPIYPKLVKNVIDDLTFEQTKELRNRGLKSPPLMKLSRNGVYVNVVEKVRDAFEDVEVVRLDCSHVGVNDCKKIGVKLRDLVPCVPLLFKDEQIILWKGKQ